MYRTQRLRPPRYLTSAFPAVFLCVCVCVRRPDARARVCACICRCEWPPSTSVQIKWTDARTVRAHRWRRSRSGRRVGAGGFTRSDADPVARTTRTFSSYLHPEAALKATLHDMNHIFWSWFIFDATFRPLWLVSCWLGWRDRFVAVSFFTPN